MALGDANSAMNGTADADTERNTTQDPAKHSFTITVDKDFSKMDIDKILRKELGRSRKRAPSTSEESNSDEIDNRKGTRKPRKLAKTRMSEDNEKTFHGCVTLLRRHYSRHYNITEEDLHKLVRQFFDWNINDSNYRIVRHRIMSLCRTWQTRWLNNYEAHWEALIKANPAYGDLETAKQITNALMREFKLENLYGIMEHAKDTVDFRVVTRGTRVYDFLLNIYVFFGLYVRMGMLEPNVHGRNVKSPTNIFDKIRALPASHSFNDITIEDLPEGLQKPEAAKRGKKRKTLVLEELHPQFQPLTAADLRNESIF